MPLRYVIVGSGIAGLSAAETIRQIDPHGSVALVSEESHRFYSRPGLAYLLRGDIPQWQLFIREPAEIKSLRLERINAGVASLDLAAHQLTCFDGRQIVYDRLLLATGAVAIPPSFPGANLVGVVKLDGLDDAQRILRAARWRRPAIVVGGGITALELAEGLLARKMRVNYFLRGKRYWSDVLDETESEIVMQRLRHEGMNIRTETQIKQAYGSRGRIQAVETQGGEMIPCRLLAVAIGVRPRVELAAAAGLSVRKGVVVNERLQADAPDVFAAGDVAEVIDTQTGASSLDVLWPIALRHGQIAGANMAGQEMIYRKETSFNVTQLAGLKTTIIGAIGGGKNEDLLAITRGESESWRAAPNAGTVTARHNTDRVRLAFDQRQIIGALVMGDQTWSRPLHDLIDHRVNISPIHSALVSGGNTALEQLGKFYQQWQQAVQSASKPMSLPRS